MVRLDDYYRQYYIIYASKFQFLVVRLDGNKLTARLIKDSNRPELMFLDKTRFPYKEVPGYFAAGTCGIYFFVTIKEPTDLCDKQDDWYD